MADTKRKTGTRKQEYPYTEKRIEPIDKRKMPPLSVPKWTKWDIIDMVKNAAARSNTAPEIITGRSECFIQ